MDATTFRKTLFQIESDAYERGRVHCTKDAPWDFKRAPVTHHGVNNTIEPWHGGPAGYFLENCEFCGATVHIHDRDPRLPPPLTDSEIVMIYRALETAGFVFEPPPHMRGEEWSTNP